VCKRKPEKVSHPVPYGCRVRSSTIVFLCLAQGHVHAHYHRNARGADLPLGGCPAPLWIALFHTLPALVAAGFFCRKSARFISSRSTAAPQHDTSSTVGGPISAEPRINDRIRVPEVRLVGPEGEQVGIVSIGKALDLAAEADLDLVEVAPMARPPVCKLMDYGKFKYESAQKAREARRNQALTVIKEMKLRPKIDSHDYETKKGHVERFLKAGDKVKITIMFRGREQSRPELGFRLLQRLAEDITELGFVEFSPKQDGRNMVMVVAPHRAQKQARPVKPVEDEPEV
jgi:translation initiation factor IF-3